MNSRGDSALMKSEEIGRNRLIAILAMVSGITIAAIGTLTPTSSGHSMMGGGEIYSLANIALVGLGLFIFAAGLVFFLVREDYQPLERDSKVAVPQPLPGKALAEQNIKADAMQDQAALAKGEEFCRAEPKEEYHLILRLLTGDERTMFRAIMDSGGEALQKDLIVNTKMSHAKVSRVIDRLEQKGVVTKERYGVTNKVRIKIEK